MTGVGPKNRVSEPVTGVAALTLAASFIVNHDYPAAIAASVLAVIPWVTSWLADKARGKQQGE